MLRRARDAREMAIDFSCFVKRRKIEIIIINQNNSKINKYNI
nr:hypothetical protein [uncultured Leptotrichia sp.]